MENKSFEFSEVSKMIYGYDKSCPYKTACNYGYALLCIAGADGEVSEPEMKWLTKYYSHILGAPKEIIEAWESFDYKKAKIEDLIKILEGVPVNFARSLIYDAIRMSSADKEYAHAEKMSVYKSAEVLGVSKEVVEQLECMVEYEITLQKHISILLETPGSRLS